MEPKPRAAARSWPEHKPGALRVEEAAKRLGISRAHAYDQIRRGVIPSLKFGRARRVSEAVIDRMIDEGVVAQ